jgi:hypothetical protein
MLPQARRGPVRQAGPCAAGSRKIPLDLIRGTSQGKIPNYNSGMDLNRGPDLQARTGCYGWNGLYTESRREYRLPESQ